jgi:hypothetical protein
MVRTGSWTKWGLLGIVAWTATANVGAAAEAPATVEQAAAVWNGTTWAVPPGVKDPQRQRAGLSYEVGGDAQTAFTFQQKALAAAQWKELPGGYLGKESSSGTYRKGTFLLSLSTFNAQPGTANVSLIAHGNVDLGKLPVPAGAKVFFAGPASVMYFTPAAPDKTTEAIAGLLSKLGWQPYGSAGAARNYKHNAVLLTAYVARTAPPDEKTSISYSTQMMSVDLPAPPQASRLQHADVTRTLSFDTPVSITDTVAAYQKALQPLGWKATLKEPVKEDNNSVMIFRNSANDMLTLTMHEFEGQTRGELALATAPELEAKTQREKAAAQKLLASKPTTLPTEAIAIPPTAKDVTMREGEITMTVAAGQAKPLATQLGTALTDAGWKAGEHVADAMAGTLSFTKGDGRLTIVYLDTGVLPAEVSLTAIGVKLDRAAAR